MSQKIQPGVGYTYISNGSGFSLDIPQQSSAPVPFQVSASGTKITVYPGTVNNLIPTIGSDFLIDSPAPELKYSPSESPVYVYIKMGADATSLAFPSNIKGATGYPQIMTSSTQLVNDDSFGYLLIATITNKGGTIFQHIQNSIGAERHKFSEPNSSIYYFWRI